jgi:hypothetical protein
LRSIITLYYCAPSHGSSTYLSSTYSRIILIRTLDHTFRIVVHWRIDHPFVLSIFKTLSCEYRCQENWLYLQVAYCSNSCACVAAYSEMVAWPVCTVAGGRAVYPVDRSAACRVPESSAWGSTAGGMSWAVGVLGSMSNSTGYSHFVAGTVHASVLGAMPRTHLSVCCACHLVHVHSGSNIQSHSIILTAKLFWLGELKGETQNAIPNPHGPHQCNFEQSSCHESTPY